MRSSPSSRRPVRNLDRTGVLAFRSHLPIVLRSFIVGKNTSLSLGEHFGRFVEAQVGQGRYSSASLARGASIT
jgi:hypothetical protein